MTVNDKVLTGIAIGLLGLGLALAAPQLLRRGVADRAVARQVPLGEEVAAGDRAAEFSLKDLSGKAVSLSSLRGKVVFLNVWATWCEPCREEMPSMETLYNEFRSDKNFVMLAVSQDRRGRAVVQPYIEKNGYHFQVLLDPDNTISQSYDVSGVPETFIIDRTGRIVAHHMGAYDWSSSDVHEALEQLLEAKNV